jgi:hypothetical protein
MSTLAASELQGESNQQRPNSPKTTQEESVRCHIKHGSLILCKVLTNLKSKEITAKGPEKLGSTGVK